MRAIVRALRASAYQATSANKRETLGAITHDLAKRVHMMDYDDLASEDLELSSGVVEGAVRFIVAQRFDEGGMRWVKERAEALLQLRGIELNGDLDDFISFIRAKISRQQRVSRRQTRLLQNTPRPLRTELVDELRRSAPN